MTCLEKALSERDPDLRNKRKAVAAANTWGRRIETIEEEIRKLYTKVSVLLRTHNDGPLLERCVEGLLGRTDYPNMEILLIENRQIGRASCRERV